MNLMLRLYEAYRLGRGAQLSAEDIYSLVHHDGTLLTAIANEIEGDAAGGLPRGSDGRLPGMQPGGLTIYQLRNQTALYRQFSQEPHEGTEA